MDGANLQMAAPPAVALMQNFAKIKRERKHSLFTQNSGAIRGRAICQKERFYAIYFHGGVEILISPSTCGENIPFGKLT